MATRVFVRDGFVDRYTGRRVVFPPVLRVISHALPEAFPFQSNWKAGETHPAYYQLAATIDHVTPFSRGGGDDESNLVTASMQSNLAKGELLLSELGWMLTDIQSAQRWDGLLPWFLKCMADNPELLRVPYFQRWYRAASP